jgi:hypothetical protein
MIKLTDLLENLIKEDGSNKQFKLNPAQYKAFGQILSNFDADIDSITLNMDEAPKPEYTKMTPDELEASGAVVAIDKSVINNLNTFLEQGMIAKNWYEDMNKKMLDALGESDGCLFLILMAIFSPQNKLSQNFLLAAKCYEGIKSDINDSNKREAFISMISLDANTLYNKLKAGEYKDMASVQKIIPHSLSVRSYLSNLTRVLRLYAAKGFKFNKADVVAEIAKAFTPTGALTKQTVISAEKVFSFTLNLLDPTYELEGGWLPVTMDTWMASFFYPQMSKKDKTKLLGKTANYVYMAKLTQELASKFGMKPIEMQAIIWVAKIKEKQGANYDVTFDNAIKKNLDKLKVKVDEMGDIKTFYQKVISVVGKS